MGVGYGYEVIDVADEVYRLIHLEIDYKNKETNQNNISYNPIYKTLLLSFVYHSLIEQK